MENLNVEKKEYFDDIYDEINKDPKIKEKIKEKIKFYALQVDNLKKTDPKSIYEENLGGFYKDTPEQLARVFAFVFERIRENMFELNYNDGLNIYVEGRRLGEKQLENGAKLTYLGEKKEKMIDENRIVECYLVDYEGKNGTIPSLRISKEYIKKVKDNKLNNNLLRVDLKNESSMLNLRDVSNLNNINFKLPHGITVKNLGERKIFNGIKYVLIEYFGKDGSLQKGYVALSYMRIKKEKTSQYLDSYIRSLGINPTINFKRNLFKKVYYFKDYRGHLDPNDVDIERIRRDNIEVYNILIINFELRKLIEQQKISLQTKERVFPVEENRVLLKKEEGENKETEKFPKREKENFLEKEIFQKIKLDNKMQNYLKRKCKGKTFKKRLTNLKRDIGYKENDFRDNVVAYIYLFQKANDIQLWRYYKEKTGKNWGNLSIKERKELFNKYAGEVVERYGYEKSSNMTIYRGLIMEYELGFKFERKEKIEKAKVPMGQVKKAVNRPEEKYKWYKETGIDTGKIITGPIKKVGGDPGCSLSVREFLQKNGLKNVSRGHAKNLIDLSKNEKISIKELEKIFLEITKKTGNNIADILVDTREIGRKGHRFFIVLSKKDGKVYVGDPYYKHNGKKDRYLYPLSEHWLMNKNVSCIINKTYKLEAKNKK